ncbi:MAG: hypothetical protein R6V77_00910 [Candidatus Cloacimonadaceae bacterium]
MNFNKYKYWLAAVALFLSLLIWCHTAASKVQTSIISLPIEYIDLPDDVLPSQLPAKNRFRVVAKGYDILKLKLSSYHVLFDASALSKDKQILDNRSYIYNDLSDYDIDLIEPFLEDIQVEKLATITSNVNVELIFADNESRQLFNDRMYKLIQDEVSIRGPERLVRLILSVKTQPVAASMLNKSKFSIPLDAPAKQIELLTPTVDIVRMDEQAVTRVITRVRINAQAGFDFFPRELTVRIRGVASLVNSLTNRDITAELVISEQKDNEIPVSIKTPPEVEILDFSPQKVTIKK